MNSVRAARQKDVSSDSLSTGLDTARGRRRALRARPVPSRPDRHLTQNSPHHPRLPSTSLTTAKEAERNAQYLARERRALQQLELERAALADAERASPARHPVGAYPGANPRDSYESSHHHVVVDASEVPGLTRGASASNGAMPFGSPDDGGIRRYPSWDDVADDIGDHGRDGHDDRPDRTRHDGDDAPVDPYAAYAAETASPGGFPNRDGAVARGARGPAVGAFPGHQAEVEAYRDPLALGPKPSKQSFAVGGVDPIEMRFDARAAREAALAEAKRAEFRAQLDEQVAFKKRAEAERKKSEEVASFRDEKSFGSRQTRAAAYGASSDDAGVRRSVDKAPPSFHAHLASPPRESMQGVPRRGVNPGNGDYSSPLARAGGGPSSFYLGGGDPYRVGGGVGGGVGVGAVDPLDGAFTRFSEGNGAFVDARAFDAAEARRRRLVADLDAQVRAKREQKRLQSLREELEDAKIERRIQEVIEQERLEREMKERLLERPDDLAEYRVANSPRASVADASKESLGLDAAASFEKRAYPAPSEGAPSEGAPAEPDPASTGVDAETYAETYEGAVIVHAEDETLRRVSVSAAEDPNGEVDAEKQTMPPEELEPEALAPVPAPPPRELPADDDASALTPQRQLQRSPEVGARRPARVDSARDKTSSLAASRALEYAEARESLETFPAPSTFPAHNSSVALETSRVTRLDAQFRVPSSFEATSLPSEPVEPAGGERRRVATPLDVKIEKLQMALERRDVDLESARDEARRLERERDLAERERDLEHQLHKIRTEMAAGGALGTAAARAAADDAFSGERRDALKLGGRSFVGTDVTSFVVRSGFVRADAPIGVSESQAMRGGDFNALVPEGYTVRPGEARRGAAPRVAGLQRRAARAAAAERGGKDVARRAAAKENDPGEGFPRRPVWGANRAPKARAPGGRAAGGNRWS